MKILILGYGLLGKEIAKQTNWDYLSRAKDNFDITKKHEYNKYFIEDFHGVVFVPKYDVIINCIAYTNTFSTDKNLHWSVNYKAVVDLADYCTKNNIKLVQISSDYIYSNSNSLASEDNVPCHNNNWYSYTKLLSDAYVQLNPKFLILRGTHKPYPFPYNNAWIDQVGNFDYVNIIAAQYINLIKKNAVGVFNVGTKLKSMYELASQTKDYLEPSFVMGETPKNVSMSLDKLNNFILNKK